jgi:1-Cys peroxiredoxin 6
MASAIFIFSPDMKLKLSLIYPATTGRSFDEILRIIDSLQLTAERKLATPANWVPVRFCG